MIAFLVVRSFKDMRIYGSGCLFSREILLIALSYYCAKGLILEKRFMVHYFHDGIYCCSLYLKDAREMQYVLLLC